MSRSQVRLFAIILIMLTALRYLMREGYVRRVNGKYEFTEKYRHRVNTAQS